MTSHWVFQSEILAEQRSSCVHQEVDHGTGRIHLWGIPDAKGIAQDADPDVRLIFVSPSPSRDRAKGWS